MLPVVTVEDVQAIYVIPDYILPNAQVFIRMASSFLSRYQGLPYDDSVNFEILVNLSAHYMMAYEPQTMKYEDMSLNHASYGKLLESTPYGQLALMLDTQGYLAGAGKKKARLYAAKDRPIEVIDYASYQG